MKFNVFGKYPELKYGVSEKSDGAMKFNVEKQSSYLNRFGDAAEHVLAGVIHGAHVAIVEKARGGDFLQETDGLITKAENLFLAVTIADCFPVYFYDPVEKNVGLAHAGWRGISKNIVKEIIEVLEKSGTDIKNLSVGIGPGIRECHFEVKEDVAKIFGTKERFINLSGIIQSQLKELGVESNNIEDSGECTYCLDKKYFSYRRDKPAQVEAMIAYIGKKHD